MSKSKRITLQSNIADLKGVGEKRSLQFNKLGIFNVGDLLAHKPNYYKDLNNLKPIFSLEEGEFPYTSQGLVIDEFLSGVQQNEKNKEGCCM